MDNQNQNCLLVILPKTIIHQGLSIGELDARPYKRVVIESSAHSEAEIRESVKDLQSLIV